MEVAQEQLVVVAAWLQEYVWVSKQVVVWVVSSIARAILGRPVIEMEPKV